MIFVENISDNTSHGGWYCFCTMLRREKPRRNMINSVYCVQTSVLIYNEEETNNTKQSQYIIMKNIWQDISLLNRIMSHYLM